MSDENKIYCCPECDSDDILFLAWVDEHGEMLKNCGDRILCQSCENQFAKAKEKEANE